MNRVILFATTMALLLAGIGYSRLKIEAFPRARAQAQAKSKVSSGDAAKDSPQANASETPGGLKAAPGVSSEQSLTPSALPAPSSIDPGIKMVSSDFIYDPSGRRDPFKPFIQFKKAESLKAGTSKVVTSTEEGAPMFPQSQAGPDSIEGYTVDELRLVGIIWEVHDPKAMLKAPSNKVFIVRKQSRIGKNNGYIAAIREGEVVVVEIAPDGKTPSTRVISLQK